MRRDLIIAAAILFAAVVWYTAFPRYEWRQGPQPRYLVRIDRWTGQAELGDLRGGRWVPAR